MSYVVDYYRREDSSLEMGQLMRDGAVADKRRDGVIMNRYEKCDN